MSKGTKGKRGKTNRSHLNSRKICSPDTLIQCPVCDVERTASEWDKDTYDKCKTAEQRNDFVSITTSGSRKLASSNKMYYYYCKECNNFIEGFRF